MSQRMHTSGQQVYDDAFKLSCIHRTFCCRIRLAWQNKLRLLSDGEKLSEIAQSIKKATLR